ncbi:MAG: capsule biosynthesis protein [Candidatus Methylomirabilales bacterium]
MAVGKHALAGALRFYVRGNLEGVPLGEAVLRRYFNASLLTAFASHRLMNTISFTCVCAIDGLYVPIGSIGEVAREQKVRVVNWNAAYRKQSFVFSHHKSFHHTLLFEPTTYWENMTWTPEMEAEILNYVKSRWYGTHDWLSYVETPQDDVSAIAAKFGIDFSKPCIGMLTNIVWEGQVLYRGTAFRNMLEWALETIRYFSDRADLQLIVRVHPAEVRGTHLSRQPIIDEIKQAFPTLPKNVFIIPPDSTISTYATMLKCDTVIIYGTQTGVELASMGIPVIVAGEAWIRNKGVTLDASSHEEYFKLLDRLPLKERLSEAVTQRARKYAYHFFFRRMGIPLPFMVPTSGWPPFKLELSGIDDLLPGRSVGLDVICNGILNGDEFIYPAELHPEILKDA